jgi:hypothetical protein
LQYPHSVPEILKKIYLNELLTITFITTQNDHIKVNLNGENNHANVCIIHCQKIGNAYFCVKFSVYVISGFCQSRFVVLALLVFTQCRFLVVHKRLGMDCQCHHQHVNDPRVDHLHADDGTDKLSQNADYPPPLPPKKERCVKTQNSQHKNSVPLTLIDFDSTEKHISLTLNYILDY